jgi:D-alanyl-D-alanine carboxypeptidase (penicillin-binding protein 5/6)
MKQHFIRSIIIIILGLIVLSFIRSPDNTGKQEFESPVVRTLLSSIVVEENARFDPLLRSGTFNELENERLENVSAYIAANANTGSVYTAKNAMQRLSPASLTKLMTAMVALDISDVQKRLVVSNRAALSEPTHLGVKPGEVFTLEEMVSAMIMTSANDAATVVGEEVLKGMGGNEQIFIQMMNKKAELLGLGHTNFVNTQGFDAEEHYSTAYDLVRMARYAYTQYPLIKNAGETPYATLEENSDHGFYHLPNWNALLGTYPGVDGLKIGYTEKAGYCTAVTAMKDGVPLIVIIMGAQSILERDLAAATLLNLGFEEEGQKGILISPSLIEPRLDEWKQLKEKIFEELGIKTIEEYNLMMEQERKSYLEGEGK